MLNTQGLLFLSMTGMLRHELNIEIHWLQSLHSAASCNQLIQGKLCIAVACGSILVAASGYGFDVFLYFMFTIILPKDGPKTFNLPGFFSVIEQ